MAEATFKPYVADEQIVPEFTLRAVLLGALMGIIFGAVNVYLALRAGLTVSASIPIAVLAISLLKRFGSTILENNIVQTAGSAGESIASGVAFTLPALIFLGFQLEISRVFLLALTGGMLGVLFMIPLRRTLIVKEHGTLTYPEGAACADVLIAGEKGGRFAGRVFTGFGVGVLYKFLNEGLRLFKAAPTYRPSWFPGAQLGGTITPEYLGVGYIIGPRVAGILFAGGVLSWLVLIPLIKFFGSHIPGPVFPATAPIAELTPQQIWHAFIRPIGAGAVTMAGIITLARTIPTIVDSFRASLADLTAARSANGSATDLRDRTARDLPMNVVLGGSAVLIFVVWLLLTFNVNPGHALANAVAAVLIVVFGFIFVTVSSRITGLIGNSSNPISGMTIATLMATCVIFVAVGWTGGVWAAVALSVGGVVCIAAANAGATSQDLKTGYLVGATPYRQQLSLLVGALASVFVIGFTLTQLNAKYTRVQPRTIENVTMTPEMRDLGTTEFAGHQYRVVNVIGSHTIPDGRYYLNPDSQRIDYEERAGIGSPDLPAPQATLMATVINGILNRNLPWGLVLFGVFIVIVLELCGVRSLPFAVGSYLPVSTTAPIFVGGVVRWLIERRSGSKDGEGEASSGALMASGLIAGGAIAGLIAVTPIDAKRASAVADALKNGVPAPTVEFWDMGVRWWPSIAASDLVALVMFVAMAFFLYRVAARKLETNDS